MKITLRQLKKIIKEELTNIGPNRADHKQALVDLCREGGLSGCWPDPVIATLEDNAARGVSGPALVRAGVTSLVNDCLPSDWRMDPIGTRALATPVIVKLIAMMGLGQ
jgi:hypothetical protein